MPIRKQDYPPNWKQLSLAARQRAGWKCEWCGAPNGKVIRRTGKTEEKEQHVGCSPEIRKYLVDWELALQKVQAHGTCAIETTADMSWKRLRYFGFTRIVLTVAHLDRNRRNNDPSNLAALCQRCHLAHDLKHHLQSRRINREKASKQQRLFERR